MMATLVTHKLVMMHTRLVCQAAGMLVSAVVAETCIDGYTNQLVANLHSHQMMNNYYVLWNFHSAFLLQKLLFLLKAHNIFHYLLASCLWFRIHCPHLVVRLWILCNASSDTEFLIHMQDTAVRIQIICIKVSFLFISGTVHSHKC